MPERRFRHRTDLHSKERPSHTVRRSPRGREIRIVDLEATGRLPLVIEITNPFRTIHAIPTPAPNPLKQ